MLTRVGRALGDVEGTVPNDHPWLREQRREAARDAAVEATRDAVAQVLRARGITVPKGLVDEVAGAPQSELIDAALACRDGADFLARVRQRRDRPRT